MAHTEAKRPTQRLLRLAVTVLLNLAFILAGVSWILSQSTRIESSVCSSLGAVVLNIDQQGWRWLTMNISGFSEVSYALKKQHFEEWSLFSAEGEDILQSFCGVYWAAYEGLGYRFLYIKHWSLTSLLIVLQVLHHRRFIAKLSFRRGKNV